VRFLLTDAELAGFLRDFAAIVQPLLANAQAPRTKPP
jgi:hypothetical protein